jgi:[1-hydroxy-2-(trimethylamino)ethyl]phosphonate dioxygenase
VTVGEEVLAIYGARGGGAYFGERLTITEHGLQAAWFAAHESAPETLIIAALLHDIGHLLEAVPEDLAEWTSDAHHEQIGGRWLARRFGPEISEPVRLHVPAKRYLCATDARYAGQLSDASVHTLRLQGGPMSVEETRRFESERYFREAVRVRLWDDQGKVAGLKTPLLQEYLGMLEAATRRSQE